jgi:2-iminobutanoate/2-iminopropanoate deaminase
MTNTQPPTQVDHLTSQGHYRRWVQAGELVFTSGLTPRDSQRRVVGRSIEEQTVAVLSLLDEVLNEAGATRADLIKLTVYLSDLELMGAFNAVYAAEMQDVKPVRTTVGCQLNGVLIEIDAVASTASRQR